VSSEVNFLFDPTKPFDQKVPSIIHPAFLITTKSVEGVRDTLAYRLGQMLQAAENLFGPRDRSFAFLGVEFTNDDPHVSWVTKQSMIIQLNYSALLDPIQAYGQLAHECIHMISPCPRKPVTILEEGIAEVFAHIYMRDNMNFDAPLKPPETAYGEAARLVAILLHFDPHGIKAMRQEEPTISLISKSLIWKHYPMLEEGMAARLARTFVRDGCTDPDILAIYESESKSVSVGG
jgi:hypothetical protein